MEAPKDGENSELLPPKTLTPKPCTDVINRISQHSVKSQSSGFCLDAPEGHGIAI
ncbi:hypothetical protein [Nostoc sphaeroides]|uniref:Uncharacterized protein n=1 Tax=Nostoc sphaeroides CCNUC1 TaxID=2653204 RepID=A0A5P8W359_9NOSO|nr:hypothetical protein [Nostoc sphaeroides]MCC5631024.1 hypothetical protein [Nostoc sphaeroides CHAB 2801]QFS47133.1 hypothetical protein GXM_04623 [Nostoc sphaeroides CCNUC1]